MKSLKPIMLVVSGMAIAFLFAFKVNTNAPVKEYATITYYPGNKTSPIQFQANGELKQYEQEKLYSEKDLVKVINDLSKEGWEISSTDAIISSVPNAQVVATRFIYLKRDKQ